MAERQRFNYQLESQRLKELVCIMGHSSNLWSFEAIRTQCLPDFQRQDTKRLLDSNPMLFHYYPESGLYSARMSRQQFEEHLNKCKGIHDLYSGESRRVQKEKVSGRLLAKKYPEVDKKYSFLLGRMFELQDSKDCTIHYFGENRRMVLLYKLHVLNEEEKLILKDPSILYVPNVGFNLRPFIDEWSLEEYLYEMIALFLNSGNEPKMICHIGSHWRRCKRQALREGSPKRHYDNFSEMIMELLPQMFLKRTYQTFCLQDRPEEEVTNERLLVEILRIKQSLPSISSFEVLYKKLPEFCRAKFATRVHLKAHCKLYPLLYKGLLQLPTSEFEVNAVNDKVDPCPCAKPRKETWQSLRRELAELSHDMLLADEDQDLKTFDQRVADWAQKVHKYCKKPDERSSDNNNQVHGNDKKPAVVSKLRRPFPSTPSTNDKPVQ